ncbi:MAG: hypothetical protein RPU64_16050 [Candidatus Sedimenticola sp. (ex Thyasira tokunagai)]
MIEVQTAIDELMKAMMSGGANAVTDIVKGGVIGGWEKTTELWKQIFSANEEAKLLADRAVRAPDDQSAQEALRKLLMEVLKQHPELHPGINISADHGSVAAEEITNTTITINNG